MRPIVSFLNSPTYAISGYLTRILWPVVWNTDYSVKNSREFADFKRDKTLNACKDLVPFDVVSLFTKIPVDLAVKVAEEKLGEDASLGRRTSLPVKDIIHLLSFCLKTTLFANNGTYYQQGFGTAMGSPVSAVIANAVMKDVEQRASANSPVKPFFWKRYVDDVISAVSGNEAGRLLSHLNSVEPFIQFTLEREKDRHLRFLDLNVSRRVQGNLEASIYRKPTHTDKYLALDSHHPICHKKPVAKTLLRRADCLPSSFDSNAEERKYVSPISCWHVTRLSRHSGWLINERRSPHHSQSKVVYRNFFGSWPLKHWKIRIVHRQWRLNFLRIGRKLKYGKKNRKLRIQWLW